MSECESGDCVGASYTASPANEYNICTVHGGQVYFRQNKPGTAWFDRCDNEKGWTVDFDLTVLRIENAKGISDADPERGVGLYVNDGEIQESIYFLEQEILFKNANVKVRFDTTQETVYRLIGKGNSLKLYARRANEITWTEISNVSAFTKSSREGNGRKPAIAEDSSAHLHAVWHDDGNGLGQLLYSEFDGTAWSVPYSLDLSSFGCQNADIAVSSDGVVYVVYETKKTDFTSVAFRYKTSLGWTEEILIVPSVYQSSSPKVAVDSFGNAHVTWEDNRFGSPEIFYNRWDKEKLSFGDDFRVTSSTYGARTPDISAYFSSVAIVYSLSVALEKTEIWARAYDDAAKAWGTAVRVSSVNLVEARCPSISSGLDGAYYVAWHEKTYANNFDIYAAILNPFLVSVVAATRITESAEDSKFPKIAVHKSNGNVYLVWEDYRPTPDPANGNLGNPSYFDPYKVYSGPRIFSAYYDTVEREWVSSSESAFDTKITTIDNRKMYAPAVPELFSGNIHILYESQMASVEDAYLPSTQTYVQIRDVIYDLSAEEEYIPTHDDYINFDLTVSAVMNRKEIRFGHFSFTLNGSYLFKNFRYYVDDAVPPFTLSEISGNFYDIGDIRVNDTVVNNYGDAWISSECGLYFYYHKTRNLTPLSDALVSGRSVRSLVFDLNNTLYASVGNSVLYSFNHRSFRSLVTVASEVTCMGVDRENRLLIGTKSNGVLVYKVVENPLFPDPYLTSSIGSDPADTILVGTLADTFASGEQVTAIEVDTNNVAWVTTRNGLYRYANGSKIHFTSANGLPTNWLNDISVRNTAIRYIATAAGLIKMVGTTFERLSAENGDVWNNNVKSVKWQEPNIIWASSLSKINQIFEREDGTFNVYSYDASSYSTFQSELDDFKTYFIIADEDVEIPENAQIEVYLNGNRITKGFDVSVSGSNRLIQFKTRLLNSDVVDVIIRNDILLLSSFQQSDAERKALGVSTIRIKDIRTIGSDIYVSTTGTENEVKINDKGSPIPYDCIHLDTTPPNGCIRITEQIDNGTVRVSISDVYDGVGGSGVDRMVISNFSNFTTDGTTPQTPVAFSSTAVQSLLSGGGGSSSVLTFTDRVGSKIKAFSDNGTIYAATSLPASVYKKDVSTGVWTKVVEYDADQYVDIIERFNGKFVVGVGHATNASQLYIYEDDDLFVSPVIRALSGSRAYSSTVFSESMYIGTSDGTVFSFDGSDVTGIFSGLSSNVYSLTSSTTSLFAGTGEAGRIYRLDPATSVSLISHQDGDSQITSMASATFGGKSVIFAGTGSTGKVLRTFDTDDSFNSSFSTVSSQVRSMRVYDERVYAAIGKAVYSIQDGGSWEWQASNTENIQDIAVLNGALYYITELGVTQISSTDEYLTIYLKLIDKAGNESSLYGSDGSIVPCRFDSVKITDLQGAVTENRLLELDEYGNVVYSLAGSGKFFSGDRVGEEQGVYDSQIFNGTNDLIKWDTLRWTSSEPSGTSVSLYVRTSASESDILTQDWVGPYLIDDSAGVDISFLSGQFLQFRAVLSSSEKGVTPVLSRVVIGSITSESIHFYTTNFVLPSRIKSGILTSTKVVPVAADIVFGVNTTNSVNWADYQIVDENRLFGIKQFGKNLRVGIKLVSPSRSSVSPSDFDEYGPYNTVPFINTVDFDFTNSGSSSTFSFSVKFYEDVDMTEEVYLTNTDDHPELFSVDGSSFPVLGKTIASSDTASVLFALPGAANVKCNQFYYVKIEATDKVSETTTTISSDRSFIAGCSASFIDLIDFNFMNSGATADFHYRIRFFTDPERTNLFLTSFSGNNTSGWLAEDIIIPEQGVTVNNGETVNVSFSPDVTSFEINKIYYLTIDAYNGTDFLMASNSYTFMANDQSSLVYCGPYLDVPIVKNFALMFELLNNELLTLNLR